MISITNKIKQYIMQTKIGEISPHFTSYLVKYIEEIDEELKGYIKGPVDRQGKPFVGSCDLKLPGDCGCEVIKGLRYTECDLISNIWYVRSNKEGHAPLVRFDRCELLEPDTLEKIKEDANLTYTAYWERQGQNPPKHDLGVNEMRLDIIERTEKVVRREYESK